MEHPAKRRRISSNLLQESDDDDELNYAPEEASARKEPEYRLTIHRARSDHKFKSAMANIFEKYGRDFEGVGDEVDMMTGEIIVDNGHLSNMHRKDDLVPEKAENDEDDTSLSGDERETDGDASAPPVGSLRHRQRGVTVTKLGLIRYPRPKVKTQIPEPRAEIVKGSSKKVHASEKVTHTKSPRPNGLEEQTKQGPTRVADEPFGESDIALHPPQDLDGTRRRSGRARKQADQFGRISWDQAREEMRMEDEVTGTSRIDSPPPATHQIVVEIPAKDASLQSSQSWLPDATKPREISTWIGNNASKANKARNVQSNETRNAQAAGSLHLLSDEEAPMRLNGKRNLSRVKATEKTRPAAVGVIKTSEHRSRSQAGKSSGTARTASLERVRRSTDAEGGGTHTRDQPQSLPSKRRDVSSARGSTAGQAVPPQGDDTEVIPDSTQESDPYAIPGEEEFLKNCIPSTIPNSTTDSRSPLKAKTRITPLKTTSSGPQSSPLRGTKHHTPRQSVVDTSRAPSSRRSILSMVSDDEDGDDVVLLLSGGAKSRKSRNRKKEVLDTPTKRLVWKEPTSAKIAVRTPEGTMRVCGVDDFECGRSFCFTCL